MKLKDKVAIVTGAARGIGRAAALELARNGADVSVNDILEGGGAAQVAREIERLGRRALVFQGDVADRAGDERMIEETVRAFGRVDILVNNAIWSTRTPFLEMSVEEAERTWAVAVWGAFHVSQFAARQMVKQGTGGNIVVVSSVHSFRPYPLECVYNAAKAALNQMAMTWAVELAPHRIRVNVLEPGWTDTPGERRFYTEEELRAGGASVPLGRLARPEEMAKGILFLVSEEDSSYMTGACLRIDGGYTLTH